MLRSCPSRWHYVVSSGAHRIKQRVEHFKASRPRERERSTVCRFRPALLVEGRLAGSHLTPFSERRSVRLALRPTGARKARIDNSGSRLHKIPANNSRHFSPVERTNDNDDHDLLLLLLLGDLDGSGSLRLGNGRGGGGGGVASLESATFLLCLLDERFVEVPLRNLLIGRVSLAEEE
jgi:hypothetical protein